MQAALSGSCYDAKSPVGMCPLTKTEIQLIPVRYALVEQPPTHVAVASAHRASIGYRPVGIRLLEEGGYLYLIHSGRPDIIYAYRLGADGAATKLEQQALSSAAGKPEFVYHESESAIVVKRAGTIQVLYSRAKLSAKLQGQLLRSAPLRQRLMQTCTVGAFDCLAGARHLLPPDQLEAELADVHPQQSPRAEGDAWCWLQQAPAAKLVDVLTSQILPAYQQDAAILQLEDPIGLMTELASAYQALLIQEETWMAEGSNRADYFAATQLLALLTLTDQQLLTLAGGDPALTAYSQAHPHALEQRYQAYWQAREEYDEAAAAMPSIYDVDKLMPQWQAWLAEEAQNQALAREIGIPDHTLRHLFEQAKEQQDTLQEGERWMHFWRPARGIRERIDEPAMRSWFEVAQARMTHWREDCIQLDNDRLAMLPAAYGALPVYDKQDKDLFLSRLEFEYHWLLGLGEEPTNLPGISEFFSTLGEQSLQLWQVNHDDMAVVEDYAGLSGVLNNVWAVATAGKTQLDGLSGVQEFQAQMAANHLELIPVLPPPLQAAMSRVSFELARLSIPQLQQMIQRIQGAQGQADSLLRYARPATVAMLLGQAKNLGVTLDVGHQPDADHLLWQQQTLGRLSTLQQRIETVLTARQQAPRDTRAGDAQRARANAELARLHREAKALRNQLFAGSQPLVGAGRPPPRSHILIRADGHTLAELEALQQLSRAALRNQVLFGRATGPALGGAVRSGGLALALLWLNGYNFASTCQGLTHKSERTVEQTSDLWGAGVGLGGTALSLAVEVVRSAAYCHWLQSGASSGLKGVGMVVTLGTTGVAALGSAASFLDGYKQMSRLARHWRRGEWDSLGASALSLTGDGLAGYANGRVAMAGGRLTMAALAGEISWQRAAAVLLRFGVRFNPYGLAATVLMLAGDLAYNVVQATALQRWASQCRWGARGTLLADNREWDHATQLCHWQEAVQTPRLLVLRRQVTLRQSVPMRGTIVSRRQTRQALVRLRIQLPMASPPQLRLLALVASQGQLVDIGPQLRQDSFVTETGLCTLLDFAWPQDPATQGRLDWLHLVLEVTTAEGNRLFAGPGGLRFSLNLHALASLTPVAQADGEPGWCLVEPLDDTDDFPLPRAAIQARLQPLDDEDKAL